MRMHAATQWLVCGIFLMLAAWPAAACNSSDCVRIGSWNIAWLGSEKRDQPSDTQTINAMADMIAKQWSIDLIALQEINTSMNGEFRGENFSTTPWRTLRAALEKHGYQTAAGESGMAQHIVLAWRKPIRVTRSISELNIPDSYKINEYCRSGNLRRPLSGLFQAGKFDFWLVGLHLKSGYGSQGRCADDVRSLQVDYMIKELAKKEQVDRDVIVLGDFNASSSHKSVAEMKSHNMESVTDKRHRNSSSNTRTQGKGKQGRLLDHIMINPTATTEWKKHSTVIYKPVDADAFTATYSDHFPVWADFNTTQDDD